MKNKDIKNQAQKIKTLLIKWWSEGESNPIDKMTNLSSRTTRTRPASTKNILYKKTVFANGFDGEVVLAKIWQGRLVRHFINNFLKNNLFCQGVKKSSPLVNLSCVSTHTDPLVNGNNLVTLFCQRLKQMSIVVTGKINELLKYFGSIYKIEPAKKKTVFANGFDEGWSRLIKLAKQQTCQFVNNFLKNNLFCQGVKIKKAYFLASFLYDTETNCVEQISILIIFYLFSFCQYFKKSWSYFVSMSVGKLVKKELLCQSFQEIPAYAGMTVGARMDGRSRNDCESWGAGFRPFVLGIKFQ